MTGSNNRASFGQILREYRQVVGLSQAALARRAGLDPSYISRLEGSSGITPRVDTLTKLARALALESQAEDEFLASAAASQPDAIGLRDPRKALWGRSSETHRLSVAPRDRVSLWSTGSDQSDSLRNEAERLETRIATASDRLDHLSSQVYSLARQAASISRLLQSAQEEAMTVAAALRRMLDDQKALMIYMLNDARIRQDEESKEGKGPDRSDGP